MSSIVTPGDNALLRYHQATNHSPESVLSSRHTLDWANQPLAFKIYTSLPPIALPYRFQASELPAVSAIAGGRPAHERSLDLDMVGRLCYFANGITRVLRRPGGTMPFRAAACTGALYHIELYAICADIAGLEAGVYHYGAHDNALRLLRRGDLRHVIVAATAGEDSVLEAPVVMALTSTYWRNSWKYQARAYRHAFWDAGTILANLLAVAAANGVSAQVVEGFVDDEVNRLLDVDPDQEAAVCLVALGRGAAEVSPAIPAVGPAPSVGSLGLPTQPLSAHQVDYPQIVAAHAASSLRSAQEVATWHSAARALAASPPRVVKSAGAAEATTDTHPPTQENSEPIEAVILRRGSSRRFAHEPISHEELSQMLVAATAPFATDAAAHVAAHVAAAGALTQPYLIVNAVDGLDAGAYTLSRQTSELQLLKRGDVRAGAAFLDLGQELAGDAAINVYWLTNLQTVFDGLGQRGYRAAQLEAAIEGGKLYLAAYALGLGATGLTFYDDEVTRFFSPHAQGKSVMFLTAVGHPARARTSG